VSTFLEFTPGIPVSSGRKEKDKSVVPGKRGVVIPFFRISELTGCFLSISDIPEMVSPLTFFEIGGTDAEHKLLSVTTHGKFPGSFQLHQIFHCAFVSPCPGLNPDE
jgi:hypothetical protein